MSMLLVFQQLPYKNKKFEYIRDRLRWPVAVTIVIGKFYFKSEFVDFFEVFNLLLTSKLISGYYYKLVYSELNF